MCLCIFIYAFRFSLRKNIGIVLSKDGQFKSVQALFESVLDRRMKMTLKNIRNEFPETSTHITRKYSQPESVQCWRSIIEIVHFYQSVSNRTRVRDWNRRELRRHEKFKSYIDDHPHSVPLRSDLNLRSPKALSSSNLVWEIQGEKGRLTRACEARNKLLHNLIWTR